MRGRAPVNLVNAVGQIRAQEQGKRLPYVVNHIGRSADVSPPPIG